MQATGTFTYEGHTLVCQPNDQVLVHEGTGTVPPRGRMIHACTGVTTACHYVDELNQPMGVPLAISAALPLPALSSTSPAAVLSDDERQILTNLLVFHGVAVVTDYVAGYLRTLLDTYTRRDYQRTENEKLVEKLYLNEKALVSVVARG